MTKKPLLLLICLVTMLAVHAQKEKTTKTSGSFIDSITKICIDFKYNFRRLQGERLLSEGGVDKYKSTLTLPGAIENIIIKYNSDYDTSATWQALMYDGEDYDQAVKAYKDVFRKIRNNHMKWFDKSSVGFIGKMESPNENLRFATSTIRTDLTDVAYKHFRLQVEMGETYSGWEVRLNIHNIKDDMTGNLEDENGQ